jgi:hypothetical protein
MVNTNYEENSLKKSANKKEKQDRLSMIANASIVIWAGLVFLAASLKIFHNILLTSAVRLDGWSVIFLGAALIALITAAICLIVPDYHRPVGRTLLWAAIFAGIGLINVFGWNLAIAVVLISLGIVLLLRPFARVL